MPCRLLLPLLLLVAPALAACGGSDTTEPTSSIGSVTVSASATSLLVGQSLQLAATARGLTGVEVPLPGQPDWRSTNTAVLTVDATGRISAVAPGTATVSASVGSVSGSLAFVVTAGATTLADVFTPGNTFSPFSVTILLGGTVRFNITGVPHNVIFDEVPGRPADVPIVNNTVASRTFNTRGTFPYDCTVHPGMVGRVVVQ